MHTLRMMSMRHAHVRVCVHRPFEQMLGPLYSGFHRHACLWEIWLMTRKLLLVCAFTFLFTFPDLQLAATIIVLTTSMGLHLAYTPCAPLRVVTHRPPSWRRPNRHCQRSRRVTHPQWQVGLGSATSSDHVTTSSLPRHYHFITTSGTSRFSSTASSSATRCSTSPWCSPAPSS